MAAPCDAACAPAECNAICEQWPENQSQRSRSPPHDHAERVNKEEVLLRLEVPSDAFVCRKKQYPRTSWQSNAHSRTFHRSSGSNRSSLGSSLPVEYKSDIPQCRCSDSAVARGRSSLLPPSLPLSIPPTVNRAGRQGGETCKKQALTLTRTSVAPAVDAYSAQAPEMPTLAAGTPARDRLGSPATRLLVFAQVTAIQLPAILHGSLAGWRLGALPRSIAPIAVMRYGGREDVRAEEVFIQQS